MIEVRSFENILLDLVDLARGSHGNDVHTKLEGGLHIWVRYYDEKKVFRLCIGRRKESFLVVHWAAEGFAVHAGRFLLAVARDRQSCEKPG